MAARTLTIDGKQVSAEEGDTILQAATDAGITIPTLCHLEGVYDVGACRLCLVEVAGVNKFLPACTTKVAEGMDIKTNTERLRKYRRMTLELLLAERHAALRQALAQLPSCCQRLLTLLIEDPPIPYAEISAALGIPVGSIGPTRFRCLDKLRRQPVIAALIDAETQTA